MKKEIEKNEILFISDIFRVFWMNGLYIDEQEFLLIYKLLKRDDEFIENYLTYRADFILGLSEGLSGCGNNNRKNTKKSTVETKINDFFNNYLSNTKNRYN